MIENDRQEIQGSPERQSVPKRRTGPETKKQIRLFSLFDYEKEQEYLREMHKQGWKFVKLNGLGVYHFEKCEPKDVIYQLDYNENGQAHKAEYLKLFADCGWEYIADFAGYSYLRKPAEGEDFQDEIFCDDESRLAMMRRVLSGKVLPLIAIIMGGILVPFILLLEQGDFAAAIFTGCFLALDLGIFFFYIVKYEQCKRRLQRGSDSTGNIGRPQRGSDNTEIK